MTSVRTAYGIIADDLTGAGDAGVQFAAAGLRTRTLRDDWTPEYQTGAEVVVVDTASRGLSAEQAYRRVAAAAARLQAAAIQIVYKKIDSTLRGPLGAEIDAVLDACGLNLALVCPAYPTNGRTLEDGMLLVEGIPVAQTPAAADPHAPVQESHLPTLLKRQTRRPVHWLHRPPSGHTRTALAANLQALAACCRAGGAVVVCDAQDHADLAAIVLAAQNLAQGLAPLLVGSAGLARPLAANLAAARNPGVLVLCGSLHPVARSQVRWLERANDPRVTILSAPAQAEAYPDPAAALADEARAWLAAHAAQGIVVTGGDTLYAVLRALQAHGVDLDQEAAPGIPLGRIAGGPWAGLRIVSKAGGFGGPGALADAAQLLMRKDAGDGR
jgi:D-threonate/D-erythronate kinase